MRPTKTCNSCKSLYNVKHGHVYEHNFCSRKCFSLFQKTSIKVYCKQCNKQFFKKPNQIKKTNNNFCSRSCSAKYNNTHKKIGTKRSKLEIWIEKQLINLYPNLNIHFNRKDAIGSELDIYIPSLKLAFELNGIFHYEPIHGAEKLSQIQNNDKNKFQKCQENKISLHILDTSSLKIFKEDRAKKYLELIIKTIEMKKEWSIPHSTP